MADIRQFDTKYNDVYTRIYSTIESSVRLTMDIYHVDAPIPLSMRRPMHDCAESLAGIFYEEFADAAVLAEQTTEEVKEDDDTNG